MQVRYYWRFNAERLSIVKLLTASTMPLGILTVVVLAVILIAAGVGPESLVAVALPRTADLAACPRIDHTVINGEGSNIMDIWVSKACGDHRRPVHAAIAPLICIFA